jgi:hypothetical protein
MIIGLPLEILKSTTYQFLLPLNGLGPYNELLKKTFKSLKHLVAQIMIKMSFTVRWILDHRFYRERWIERVKGKTEREKQRHRETGTFSLSLCLYFSVSFSLSLSLSLLLCLFFSLSLCINLSLKTKEDSAWSILNHEKYMV